MAYDEDLDEGEGMGSGNGLPTMGLVIIVFVALFLLISLAVMSYGIGIADHSFSSLNLTIGNTTWNQTYQQQMHPGMESLRTTGPQIISIGTFFGMILCLFFVSVKVKGKSNIWVIADIAIIIVSELVAVAISHAFRDNIMSISPELLTVFSTTLSTGSKFILNLPAIIPTVGIIVMLGTYLFKKEEVEDEREQSVDSGGFY